MIRGVTKNKAKLMKICVIHVEIEMYLPNCLILCLDCQKSSKLLEKAA